MVKIKTDIMVKHLRWIGRNYNWLAERLASYEDGRSYTKGYISLLVRNHCKIPRHIEERLLEITGMPRDKLFFINTTKDNREWFGGMCCDKESGQILHDTQESEKKHVVDA